MRDGKRGTEAAGATRGGPSPVLAPVAPSLPIPPCIIALPPRNDDEGHTEGAWALALPDGADLDGQRFTLPEGISVRAKARWIETPTQSGHGLLSVSLSLEGTAIGACARCLKDVALEISDDLMYVYCPCGIELGDMSDGEDIAAGIDAMPVEVSSFGRTLDVAPQVWESLLLLLPTKPLCRPGCLGLCPNCGADLDDGPCGCEDSEGDPRFDVLRSMALDDER